MQILEIYIHTIIYIHIHTYTTSSTTTTHTTHTTGGRGVLIHSYTYIYNFFHHHHHHPPPPTPPTPQGGGGYTTTHHHPHHRGEGGTGALLYRPITMGWGGGRYLAMLAHIYIYNWLVEFDFHSPKKNIRKAPHNFHLNWSNSTGVNLKSSQPSPPGPAACSVHRGNFGCKPQRGPGSGWINGERITWG